MNLWEMLVPSGKYEKHIRFVLGLILISIVVVPFSSVFENLKAYKPGDAFSADLRTEMSIEAFNGKYIDILSDTASKRLLEELRQKTSADIKSCDIILSMDENDVITIEAVEITADDCSDLKSLASKLLGTDEEKIHTQTR
jgi:hypothetical protein